MHKWMKRLVGGLLTIIVGIGSPVLFAQDKQPNNPAGAISTAEGKILWQYDTHG